MTYKDHRIMTQTKELTKWTSALFTKLKRRILLAPLILQLHTSVLRFCVSNSWNIKTNKYQSQDIAMQNAVRKIKSKDLAYNFLSLILQTNVNASWFRISFYLFISFVCSLFIVGSNRIVVCIQKNLAMYK